MLALHENCPLDISPHRLVAQAKTLRQEIGVWEAKAADVQGDIDAELQLAARQRRAERIQAEIERLQTEARPLGKALEAARATVDRLQQE